MIWIWALQGVSGWALQGVSGVAPGRGWALRSLWVGLQESLAFGVGHSRESLGLGTPGVSGFGHSRESLGIDRARRRAPGEEKNSNNPTPKVGNNKRHVKLD